MNIEHIQEKLNAIFNEPSLRRKLVLWYDDTASFAEDIGQLVLDNAKVICLDGHNSVYSKYVILRQERESNFLIYAPFPKPGDDDETNHFLDISFYAMPFYADALYDLCEAYGIPRDLKPVLEEEKSFWKKEAHARKVRELGLTAYTEQTLRRAVMAVLCNLKTIQIDEIMKTLLRTEKFQSRENPFLRAFRTAHVETAFWQDVSLEYGYAWPDGEEPSLTGFLLHCVYSYWEQTVGDVPKKWKVTCRPRTTGAVFLGNAMAHSRDREWIDAALLRIGQHLDIAGIVGAGDVLPYGECDAFSVIDEACIRQFSRLLAVSPREFNSKEMECIRFRRTTAHYASRYGAYYQAIEYAQELGIAIRRCAHEREEFSRADDMIRAYTESWHRIDMCYRKFYELYDAAEQPELFGDLPAVVENVYIQQYLEPLASRWGHVLRQYSSYDDVPGMKQRDFFAWYVAKKKDMTAVIISDALRYECGAELCARMAEEPNMAPVLEYMLANVPTYTQLGMASLLPHQHITLDIKGTMVQALADGESTVGSARREQLLRRAVPMAKVMHLADIMQLSRAELRRELKDVRLLYVYHDAIDSTGDSMKTEDKVFAAAAQGMDEIMRCVKKLAVDKSIVRFVVTADHGFLYRRSDVPVYTKVRYPRQGTELYRNKRYILSAEPMQQEGVISWPASHVGSDGYVNCPMGCDIFSLPGGGQHFVHGGLSLQEFVVPVIAMKYTKQKVDTAKVSVKWYSPQMRLTEIHNYIKFLQEDCVTDTKLARTVTVCVEDTEGHQLSNDVTVIANRTTRNAVDRIYTEKLILADKTYSHFPAYVVIRDADTGEETARYDVEIDVLPDNWSL